MDSARSLGRTHPDQKEKFPPIAPDFILDLLSPTHSLRETQSKMQEYIRSGVKLGWLLDPRSRRVEIYRPDRAIEILESPVVLSGETVLVGFSLDLTAIWSDKTV